MAMKSSSVCVVTEFCCHFFMLNFKLLFNLFRAKISLSCKVFILQTTTLAGLSTREFRTYNLWQISSIIEICLGFQKSFKLKDTCQLCDPNVEKLQDVALLHRLDCLNILGLRLRLHYIFLQTWDPHSRLPHCRRFVFLNYKGGIVIDNVHQTLKCLFCIVITTLPSSGSDHSHLVTFSFLHCFGIEYRCL